MLSYHRYLSRLPTIITVVTVFLLLMYLIGWVSHARTYATRRLVQFAVAVLSSQITSELFELNVIDETSE